MEEDEKTEENTEAKKVDDPKEVQLHSKAAKGEENGIEKQVDPTIESQHFVQYQPSAPPQPTMVQVKPIACCFHHQSLAQQLPQAKIKIMKHQHQ